MFVLRRLRKEFGIRGVRGGLRFIATRLVLRRTELLFKAQPPMPGADAGMEPFTAIAINRENVASADTMDVRRQILQGHNEEYEEGLHANDWLFAGTDRNGAVATYAFVLFNTAYKDVLGLPESVPLIANCYTMPEWRGRRLYPWLLRHACGTLASAGHDAVYISCDPDNVASIKGIERAGFKLMSHIRCVSLLSKIVVLRKVTPQTALQPPRRAN